MLYSCIMKKNSMKKKKVQKNNALVVLFFLILGIFLFLALVTYHPEDPVGFTNAPKFLKVKNIFGIVGSTIAGPLFTLTTGYGSLAIPLLIFYLVFAGLRNHPWKKIAENSLKLLVSGFLAGILLNLPEGIIHNGRYIDFYPGGYLSARIVQLLIIFSGKFGTIFITLIAITFFVLWLMKDISPLIRAAQFVLALLRRMIRIGGYPYRLLASWWERRKLSAEEAEYLEVDEQEIEEEEESRFSDEEEMEEYLPGETVMVPIEGTEEKEDQSEYLLPPEEEIEEFPPPGEKTPVFFQENSDQPDDPLLLKRVKLQMRAESQPPLQFELEKQVEEKEVELEDFIQSQLRKYEFPPTEILFYEEGNEKRVTRDELEQNARLLIETLSHFNVEASLVKVVEGPVVTQYQLKPAEGVKISRITSLQDDLALALRARGIRIIAPIPGKAAIGVEIPNRNRSTVYFKSAIRSQRFAEFSGALPIALGKTINGEVFVEDLAQMPHLLIGGATGTGKSVGLNVIISSLLYRLPPTDVKFILIDPKRLEFSLYEDLKDHYLAFCPELDEYVITEPENAVLMLQSLAEEMEKRYLLLKEMGVRSIAEYNEKIKRYTRKELQEQFQHDHHHLPYLVVVIDELADLMLTSAREVEEPIARLAQKARAAGIHMVLATQRPSVNVITGIIKANFPVRIAYLVSQKIDSKVILDMSGAEQLIGKGDMLFKSPAFPKPIRVQTALITTDEVEQIVQHIRKQPKFPPYTIELIKKDDGADVRLGGYDYRDELFEQAKEIVILHQSASASLLQRKLRIGYARAASIIDQLEQAGIVGPPSGSKPREVLIDKERFLKGEV